MQKKLTITFLLMILFFNSLAIAEEPQVFSLGQNIETKAYNALSLVAVQKAKGFESIDALNLFTYSICFTFLEGHLSNTKAKVVYFEFFDILMDISMDKAKHYLQKVLDRFKLETYDVSYVTPDLLCSYMNYIILKIEREGEEEYITPKFELDELVEQENTTIYIYRLKGENQEKLRDHFFNINNN